MSIRPVEDIIAILLSFVVAITVHEFMHAWTAHKLGDNTARNQGRITLNPMSHFEPFGFFGMLMISIGYPFIGWGKPVPVAPWKMTKLPRSERRRGMALVALAGPASNVVQAGIAAIVIQIAVRNGIDLGQVGFVLNWFVTINILLAAFNMIPIPPLDGGNVLAGLLPDSMGGLLHGLRQYGFIILYALLFTGVLWDLIGPPFNFIRGLLL